MAIAEATGNGDEQATDEPPHKPEIDPDPLDDEVSELIEMLKAEIGLRWMSIALRFKIEEVEILLGQRGTAE